MLQGSSGRSGKQQKKQFSPNLAEPCMGSAIPAFQSGKKIIVQVTLSGIFYLFCTLTNEVFLKKATWDDKCPGASHFCGCNLMGARAVAQNFGRIRLRRSQVSNVSEPLYVSDPCIAHLLWLGWIFARPGGIIMADDAVERWEERGLMLIISSLVQMQEQEGWRRWRVEEREIPISHFILQREGRCSLPPAEQLSQK